MEKKINLVCLLLVLLLVNKAVAQEKNYIRAGLISTQLTLSPTYMFSEKSSSFSLHGSAEVFITSRLSAAGESYYNLGNLGRNAGSFQHNHSLFWGASWHFSKNNNDLYIGLQPGISISKLYANRINVAKTQLGVNPLFSTVVGYNFFLYDFFHFFVQTRWVYGEHHYDKFVNISDLRLSAGLGFNLNLLKEKR